MLALFTNIVRWLRLYCVRALQLLGYDESDSQKICSPSHVGFDDVVSAEEVQCHTRKYFGQVWRFNNRVEKCHPSRFYFRGAESLSEVNGVKNYQRGDLWIWGYLGDGTNIRLMGRIIIWLHFRSKSSKYLRSDSPQEIFHSLSIASRERRQGTSVTVLQKSANIKQHLRAA